MAGFERRAAWPSFFIFAAGLLLLAASLSSADALRWGAIALLAASCAPWSLPRWSLTALLLALLCGWMLVNAIAVTPAYTAESLYRPLILATAFAAVAAQPRETVARLYRAGLAVVALIVLLGLVQYFFGVWRLGNNPLRAAGAFATPNTFAAATNVFLLPLAVIYVTTDRSPRTLALVLWLFAGVVASQSRGGMLSLFVGLAFAAVCMGQDRIRNAAPAALRLIVAGAAVWVAIVGLGKVVVPLTRSEPVVAPSLDAWVDRPVSDRSEIYATTLRIILDRPLLGAGANMFRPLFEPRRSDEFLDVSFLFAHNDYLQVWLEFGLAGVLLLVGLAAAALVRARAASRAKPIDPRPAAAGAGLASLFAHAAVDYPFYIPFLLFVSGALLAAVAAPSEGRAVSPSPRWLSAPIRGAILLAALAFLAQPTLAELATQRSLAVLGRGDVNDGLYWQSVARRLEPRDPAHYWAEATTWQMLAADTRNQEFWTKADALLREGARANPPLSFTIALERARMHRVHHAEIANAATPEEIVRWTQEAAARLPRSALGQAELARALAFAGRKEEARQIERALAARQPESMLVQRLARDLQ